MRLCPGSTLDIVLNRLESGYRKWKASSNEPRLIGGRTAMTAWIAARTDLNPIIEKVHTFDSFDAGNAPYAEHDFGAFMIDGEQQIFWGVDYYDLDLSGGSPDPADPAVTCRVLTVMLAEEY